MTGRRPFTPRSGRVLLKLALWVLLVAAVFAVSGCRKPPDDAALRLAWGQLGRREVDKALPVIRAYLLAHPDSVPAHYMLGKCFLHRKDANSTAAKGEMETALALLDRGGAAGILAEVYAENQFRATLHQDIALALMRAIYDASGAGLPEVMSLPVVEKALEHVRQGLASDPESSYLKEMEATLEGLRQPKSRPAPERQSAPARGEISV